jgi:ankyrin repeat protein
LIVAVNNGLTDFYNCLLEAGADPDVRDDVSFFTFRFSVTCFFTRGKLCKPTFVKLNFADAKKQNLAI